MTKKTIAICLKGIPAAVWASFKEVAKREGRTATGHLFFLIRREVERHRRRK